MPRKTSLHKKKGRDSWERLSEVNEKESSSFQKTSSPQRPIDLPPTVFINQSSEKPSNEVDLIPAPIWYRPNYDQKDIFDNRHQFEVEQGPDVLSFYPAYPTLENSPIESVRATVSKNDDRTLPCLTFRFWVLSFFFTVFGAAFSQYYYFTTIPYQFSVFFVQLATYPLGRLMAKVLPRKTIRVGEWFCFSLNPGPFNMKEHALIGVAASASAYPYAIYALTAQKLFFAQQFSHVGSLFLLISSQCLGYGLAGMVYPILVEMPDMIWPLTLVNVAFYNTLHETKYNFIRSLSRMQFFWIVFICIFIWELLPQFFAPILMSFTVLCYFGHKNPHLVNLGSANRGVGILGITFDWMQITTFMPLSSPWWAQANVLFGAATFLWIIMPIVYYTNFWNARDHPIVSTDVFDTSGRLYNVSRILNSNTSVVDEAKFAAYSPIRMSAFFALAFGFGFITITSAVTHVYLWHGSDMLGKLKSTILEVLTRDERITQFDPSTMSEVSSAPFSTFERDPRRLERDACVHANMMKAYPKIPIKWYTGLFGLSLVMACAFTVMEPIALPMWGVFAAIVLAIVGIVPTGVIQAMTNQQIGLNIVSEVIGGYIFPGRPIANTTFKTYSYWGMGQCLTMLQQFKLGQYMKIPPRKMFIVQIYGTLLAATVSYTIMNFMINSHREEIISDKGGFSANIPRIVYSASVIWGAAGPQRIFGYGSPYFPLVWLWFIGFLLPVPFYLLHKRFPKSKFPWKFVNIPLIFLGAALIVQFPKNNIIMTAAIGFFTQFSLYRYRHDWWRKYNYVGNAALDSGAQICTLLVFLFTNGFFTSVKFPTWYGNNPLNPEQCGAN